MHVILGGGGWEHARGTAQEPPDGVGKKIASPEWCMNEFWGEVVDQVELKRR